MGDPDRRPLVDLDEPICSDIGIAGGKAAALARARGLGLPVLPGFVVRSDESRFYMSLGASALAEGGSGRARLSISTASRSETLDSELTRRGAKLGGALVVRSSGVMESDAQWSGAFASYLEITPDELGRAVIGCWASTFTVAALKRHRAMGVEPGSIDMAVLIQPAVMPDFAGTARITDDVVGVSAIAGSPVPLVQGWEPGSNGRVGPDGNVSGSAVELLGAAHLERVAQILRRASDSMHATDCEWAIVDGEVVFLQLGFRREKKRVPMHRIPEGLDSEAAQQVARITRRFPDALGSELVLPWAVAMTDPPAEQSPALLEATAALAEARSIAADLTRDVWNLPPSEAAMAAAESLRELRGPQPAPALDRIRKLRQPDHGRVKRILALLAVLEASTVDAGPTPLRVDRWAPYNISCVLASGVPVHGDPAAPGIAFGRMRWIGGGSQVGDLRRREVLVSFHPVPNLAPLLWGSAGVVTVGGNPGAHLFASARALGVPAVARVDLEPANGDLALVVDGTEGVVYVSEW